MKVSYPFKPKSNKLLLPGQFWGIKLSNGKYACGRVVQIPEKNDLSFSTKVFLAGLMDWVGTNPPTAESIAGGRIIKEGNSHILSIRYTSFDGMIHGFRPLDLDSIEPKLYVVPFKKPMITRGYKRINLNDNQRDKIARDLLITEPDGFWYYKVLTGWSSTLIKAYAEKYFVERSDVKD